MKITIMGGTGYLGQGILAGFVNSKYNHELISLSRSGMGNKQNLVMPVSYLAVDFSHDGNWQSVVTTSDIVIDCVGILIPSKRKQTSYEKNSIEPAKKVIDQLQVKTDKTKFIFIAANNAPRLLDDYLKAKQEVIDYGQKKLDNRFIAVYPGMVYDLQRLGNFIPGILLNFAINGFKIPFLKKYRPVKRSVFSQEIVKIAAGQSSPLTKIIR